MAEGGVGDGEEITGDVVMGGREMTEGEVRAETLEHIKQVNAYVLDLVRKLLHSAKVHDTSKLEDPEKELFRKYTPLLKDCTYGGTEYRGYLAEMKVALDHHYADPDNRHHPEHFENGIDGMTLMDLIEMICDWKAATKRHIDGCINKSLVINSKRFDIGHQLVQILRNTVEEME